MRVLGFDLGWSRKSTTLTLDQLIRKLEMAYDTISGITVTPESCLASPTVQAIVRTISSRLSTIPGHVYVKSESQGRERKEMLPNHPVARLLDRPNEYQDRTSYWVDLVSWLVRYGNFYAFKARGATGPIRRLEPLMPWAVTPVQGDDLKVIYRVQRSGAKTTDYPAAQIHHARLMSRDGVVGDSPVMNARESIALEIAAERFGSAFFGNGALPSLVFQYVAGSAGHRNDEERKQFIEDVQAKYSGKGRFRAMLLPKGVELADDPIALDNDKAQFLQTRQYQRTVIAGAFGIPPQFVGDLQRATFNNAEQQAQDFDLNVLLPYAMAIEAAVERDLFTAEDRAGGVIFRFNFNGALRADFRTQQEGLKIQREAGIISPNDWREMLGMNPIAPDDGGDDYWRQGPSGQRAGAVAEPAMTNGNGNGNNGR